MKSSVRILALVAATAAATTAIVVPYASTAQARNATPAPQLVAGLPDFTHLVEEVGPAVVNVEAQVGARRTAQQQGPGEDEIPEIFRRFFGPGMPFPGMPDDGPQGGPRGVSMGTGFIISADGYVLTNHHVVEGADEVKVKLSDRRELTARVVGSDEQSDVALLKVAATGLPALRIGDSKALKPGQWVVAIGSPFGLDHSVTAGIVSAVGRSNPYANQRYVPFIQTDVAINRGNSGGPLLDTRGQVVGINSQIFSNSGGYMGVSFAIPIDTAMGAVNQLKATGKVQRGMLGIEMQPSITSELAQAANLPDTTGVMIANVTQNGPAAKAGIQRGDVIRSINGTKLMERSDLPPIVGAMSPGARVTLGVLRDGRERNVVVTLAPLDEGGASGVPSFEEPSPRQSGAPAFANPLGLIGQDLDAEDRRQLGLQKGEGVGVARVQGLTAREAGLRPGDVILAVGRTNVASVSALDRELSQAKSGDTVMLLVRRGAGTQYIAVTLN